MKKPNEPNEPNSDLPMMVPMMVAAYGVPPTMGPRDPDPMQRLSPWPWPRSDWTPAPGPVTPVAPANTEALATVKGIAEALAALRLAPEITRPEHRALLDLCASALRRAAELLEGGR